MIVLSVMAMFKFMGNNYRRLNHRIGAQLEAGKIDAVILGREGMGSFGSLKAAR